MTRTAILTLEEALPFPGDMARSDEDRSGLVYESPEIVLRRRAGHWQPVDVTGLSDAFAQCFFLDDLTWTPTSSNAQAFSAGTLGIRSARHRFRRDLAIGRMLHHTPPEVKPVIGWHLDRPAWVTPQWQRFEVRCDRGATGMTCRLTFDPALPTAWSGAEQALTMEARLRSMHGHKPAGWGVIPRWNKAAHDLVADTFAWDGDRISMTLSARLQPDRWRPADGQPRRQTFHLAAPVTPDGTFTTAFMAQGELGAYTGRVTGVIRRTFEGTYEADGVDGPRSGRVWLEEAASSAPRAPAVPDANQSASAMLRDSFALAVELTDAWPRPWSRPQAPARVYADTDNGAAPDASAARRWARAAEVADATPPATGVAQNVPEDWGPFHGRTDPLPFTPDGRVSVTPDDAPSPPGHGGQWRHVPRWYWSGPWPDAQPLLWPERWPSAAHPWTASDWTEAWDMPDAVSALVLSNRMAACAWYGACELDVARAGIYWFAVPANTIGCLWLNETPVWHGVRWSDNLLTAVFPARLNAGVNRLLFRAGVTDLQYNAHGSVQPNARAGLRQAAFGVAICAQTPAVAPAPALSPTGQPPPDDGPDLPRVWDYRSGAGVAWRLPLTAGYAPVIRLPDAGGDPAGDRLYVIDGDGAVLALAADTGRTIWRLPPTAEAARPTALAVNLDRTHLLLTRADGAVEGLNPATGARVWRITAARGQIIGATSNNLWCVERTPKTRAGVDMTLTAMRIPEGHVVWRAPVATDHIIPIRLVNGARARTVLVAGDGALLCAATGTRLHEHLAGGMQDRAALAWADDVLYFRAGGADEFTGGWRCGWKAAVRLRLTSDDRVMARLLWRATGPSHQAGAQPVVHDGRLYVFCVGQEHHMEYPCPWSNLHIYDAATGTQLADVKPLLYDAVDPVGLLVTGNLAYCIEGGTARAFGGQAAPRVAVVALGGAPAAALPIAENAIPAPVAPPLLAGRRLIVPAQDALWAFGECDAADRRRGDEAWAQALLERTRLAVTPMDTALFTPEPVPATAATNESETVVLRDRGMPERWLWLGPLPASAPSSPADLPDFASACTHPAAATDARRRWRALPPEALRVRGVNFIRAGNDWYYTAQYGLDILRLTDARGECAVWLYSRLDNDAPGCYQFATSDRATDAWLSGQAIKPGDRVMLARGVYPLRLRHELGRLPAFVGADATLLLRADFRRVASPDEHRATQARALTRQADQLRALLPRLPDTHPLRRRLADAPAF